MERPTGVTILAVLYFIGTAILGLCCRASALGRLDLSFRTLQTLDLSLWSARS
jgi:hypothetical protein